MSKKVYKHPHSVRSINPDSYIEFDEHDRVTYHEHSWGYWTMSFYVDHNPYDAKTNIPYYVMHKYTSSYHTTIKQITL